MRPEIEYKSFNRTKSINELLYNSSLWISEFNFIKIELTFFKHFIQSYPFKSKIPNLFEHLQLFIQELDNFEKEKNNIIDKIDLYTKKLSDTTKNNNISYNNFYLVKHEKLAEEVFNYMQQYKNLKTRIFNYVNGITP